MVAGAPELANVPAPGPEDHPPGPRRPEALLPNRSLPEPADELSVAGECPASRTGALAAGRAPFFGPERLVGTMTESAVAE